MSRQMKLLMENFNKFIEEEMDMEEEGKKGSLDSVLDDILDDALMEGLLKEMFPTPEEAAEGAAIMAEPSKEDIKSGIKQVVKSAEGQKAAKEIEQKAGPQAGLKEYIAATKAQINDGMLGAIGLAAGTIPGLAFMGAMLGAASQEPHHSHSAWLDDPERINQAIDAAAMVGAQGGAAIGSVLLALVVAGFIKDIKEKAPSYKRD
tara:strand:- start:70 stop:684 length:615 start_codon:yes stop_codon:yes gene_type:complete